MSDSLRPHGLWGLQVPLSMEFSRGEYWSGLPLPKITPTQGSGLHLLHLLHCRWILYHYAIWETGDQCISYQSNEETKQKLFLDSQRKKLRLMVIKWLGIYTAEVRACTRNWAFTFKIAISQGRRLGGATPRLRSRVVAKRSKSTSKERWLRGCRRA